MRPGTIVFLSMVALALVAPRAARANCSLDPSLCGLSVTSTIEQADLDIAIDVVLVGDGFTTASAWSSAANAAINTFKTQTGAAIYAAVPSVYNFHVVNV